MLKKDSFHDGSVLPEIPAEVVPVPPQPVPMVTKTSTFSLLIFVLCFLLAIFLIPSLAYQIDYALTSGSEKAKADVARELLKEFPDTDRIVPWVVKSIRPSVVGIQQVVRGEVRYRGGRVQQFEMPDNEGSGVIVDPEGYVITNYHVIRDAQALSVLLSDDRRISGERVTVAGFDQEADIAVLKIDLSELTAMPWGNSDKLEVGEAVLAIGNPYGLFQTVTAGIISGKERYSADSSYKLQEFLQTDAAVNPGNSGGPLINLKGELVGINTAIYGEAYQGISFAIPSALVKRIYEEIRKNGRVTYGWLGINMSPYPVTETLDPGSERRIGVEINQVVEDSPASKSGLHAGDIITNWNGQEIRDFKQLHHSILFTKPDSEVTVKVLREKEPREFRVVVGKRPMRRR
ncbi:MAG: trypsin-like peptidase domain-containing protein [Planctomycetaceae bacterium]|nr:trypsin-like peptidase domain-containing protein [Planctomycetaceae bacterium]